LVEFEIVYNGRKYISTIYDRWDMRDYNHTVVSRIHNVTKDDVGKFLKLNDGSNQFVKIVKVYKSRVYTSGGLYFKWETICVVNPRIALHEYSGAKNGDESFLVKPATYEEKEYALVLANGGKVDKVTKRISMLSKEELRNRILEKGHNENSVIDRVCELAFGKTNQHTMNALKAVGNALEMDIFTDRSKQLTMTASVGSIANKFGYGKKVESIEEAKIVYAEE